MSRYIDADAIITFVGAGHLRNPMEKTWSDNDVVDMIESRPTVDAVPVVRCGRCEYYSSEMNCCSYVNGLQNVTKTDYCSYGRCADGERRTE